MISWFGPKWNKNCCDPNNHVKTPVGDKCAKCTSHIEEGEQGVILFSPTSIDVSSCDVEVQAWHLNCLLKTLLPPESLPRYKHFSGLSNPGKN